MVAKRAIPEVRLSHRSAIPALRLVSDWPDPAAVRTSGEPVRARGELRLAFTRRAGATRLTEAYQSGCLRARVPAAAPGEDASVVLINTGGGVTGGDRLRQSVRWAGGVQAAVTTQAAEKVYRAASGEVEVRTTLQVEPGAVAEWLPQETILFDRARLDRRTRIEVAADARFLGLEMTVLGRAAMGETVRDGLLSDRWTLLRDGRLVYADAQRLEGPINGLMDRPAIGGGARAMAVLLYAAPDAPARLDAAREALAGASGRAAASAWNGLLAARFLAPDGHTLKADVTALLATLRDGRPLPRVWTC